MVESPLRKMPKDAKFSWVELAREALQQIEPTDDVRKVLVDLSRRFPTFSGETVFVNSVYA